jgi:carbon monoxide dehydrogenase subunit G
MKYSLDIEINLPREKVIELFDNPDNLKQWQPGFISYKHLSGDAGKPGSKTKLLYKMGGRREVEMIETITVRNLPEEISGTYEAKGVWNHMQNTFAETEKGTTIYTAESEFKLKGFMKLMGILMPGAFKKQTYKYMKLFKEFAEKS